MQERCPENGQNFYDELTSRTLEIVLGIPQERFLKLNQEKSRKVRMSNWVTLPPPWANYFIIIREKGSLGSTGEGECSSSRVWFEVQALEERLFALENSASSQPFLCEKNEPENDVELDNQTGTAGHQTEKPDLPEESIDHTTAYRWECADDEEQIHLLPIGDVEAGRWKLFVEPWMAENRSKIYGEEYIGPKYKLTSTIIEKLLTISKHDCYQGFKDQESCRGLYQNEINFPSGFFNFVEHLSVFDAYSYAIFPKNDLIGILAETSATLSGGAPGAGFLGVGTGLSESRTVSVMVGYGDGKGGGPGNESGRAGGDDSIAFGWVISTRGDMEPTLKSQLALVSVPAWSDKLRLNITVGWLDRESDTLETTLESFVITISVPPDIEALDSLLFRDFLYGPRIHDHAIDKNIYVKSGQALKILIPGLRLWRSASVTLGAQLAERIRVMPNMEGIIAEFNEIDLPHAAYHADKNQKGDSPRTAKQEECGKKGELDSRPVSLRVWTSEGVAKASQPVCVFYDMAEVESGGGRAEDPHNGRF